jgi:hypothetical protein
MSFEKAFPRLVLFVGGGSPPGEVSRKVLSMGGDCRAWFEKWNGLLAKKADGPEDKQPKGDK